MNISTAKKRAIDYRYRAEVKPNTRVKCTTSTLYKKVEYRCSMSVFSSVRLILPWLASELLRHLLTTQEGPGSASVALFTRVGGVDIPPSSERSFCAAGLHFSEFENRGPASCLMEVNKEG